MATVPHVLSIRWGNRCIGFNLYINLTTGYLLVRQAAFPTCLFSLFTGKKNVTAMREWNGRRMEWSGLPACLADLIKPTAAASLSLSYSIPARSRRAQWDPTRQRLLSKVNARQKHRKCAPAFFGHANAALDHIPYATYSIYSIVCIYHIVYSIHMYYMAWAAIKITRCLSIFGTPTRYGFPLQSPAIEFNFLLFTFDHNSKFASQKCNHKKHPEKCHLDGQAK